MLKMFRRAPDEVIGNDPDAPYMRRWYLIPKNKWCNVYLHNICRSDDDRALHDHPWPSVSLILSGIYKDIIPTGERLYGRGSIILRGTKVPHRLEMVNDKPIWTLFITGPKVQDWGFHCPKGWVHNETFEVKGCDD